jgi:hypothetical protein
MLSRNNFRVSLLSLTLILVGILIAIPPFAVRSDYGNGTGPGGVGTTNGTSNLVLWLYAGSLPQNNGSPVSTWTDKSGYGNHANQSTGDNQPTLQTNIMNGQPVVRFDGSISANDYLVVPDNANLDNTTGLSIVTVANPSNLGSEIPRGLISKRGGYRVEASYSLFFLTGDFLTVDINTYNATPDDRFSTTTAYLNGTSKIIELIYDGSLTPSDRSKVYNEGLLDITAFETSPTIPHYNRNLVIGTLNEGYGAYFGGDIPEVIIFREALNLARRTLVENYLGAKYDLTVLNNRYDGSTTGKGDFDLNVSGIGQEADGSNTIADSAGMIISNQSYLTNNGDYLLFGHRTSVNSNTTDDLPTDWASLPNAQRWARSWYIDVTDIAGNGGSVNITFDFSEANMTGVPGDPSNYRLLKRSVAGDPFEVVGGISASISGDQVIFNGVGVTQLGSDFTLGTLDSSSSPTAIKLLSFTASTLSSHTIVGILFVLIGSVIMVSSRLLPKQKI